MKDDELHETVIELKAILPRVETKLDRVVEQVSDLSQAMLRSEAARKETCPHRTSIAANAKAIQELRGSPGKIALSVVKYVAVAGGAAMLAKWPEIAKVLFP